MRFHSLEMMTRRRYYRENEKIFRMPGSRWVTQSWSARRRGTIGLLALYLEASNESAAGQQLAALISLQLTDLAAEQLGEISFRDGVYSGWEAVISRLEAALPRPNGLSPDWIGPRSGWIRPSNPRFFPGF